MTGVIYSGQCTRCGRPADAREDGIKRYAYVACGKCGLTVVCLPPGSPEKPPEPPRCGDCTDLLRYDYKRQRYGCPRCDTR
jgi:DNA-directed RNA polymerase subunit RPC12/RpoP